MFTFFFDFFINKIDIKKIFFLQAEIRDLLCHGLLLFSICIRLDSHGQCLSDKLRIKSINLLKVLSGEFVIKS